MKIKILAVLLICSALFLTACSQGQQKYQEIQEQYEKSNLSMQDIEEGAQQIMDDYGLTEDDIIEDYSNEPYYEDEESTNNPSTMRICSGGDPHYLIYVTQDSAFQRVNAGGGIITSVTTKYQTCSVAEPSEVPVQCGPISPGQYKDNYGAVKALTEEPVASMFGLTCSNIDYDESVFILE